MKIIKMLILIRMTMMIYVQCTLRSVSDDPPNPKAGLGDGEDGDGEDGDGEDGDGEDGD